MRAPFVMHVDEFAHPYPLGSVIIAAHNEAAGISRCLDALFDDATPAPIEVVVVCNGCTDETAAIARATGHPVRVIELAVASKPAALRAGDAASRVLPRIYLDADVVLPGSSARLILERLRAGAIAARPPVSYDSSRSSVPVRRYYRARSRVPALNESLWGVGVYGLSETGRQRFEAFPDIVADDLWVDRQFAREEVEIVHCAPAVVSVPRRSSDLMRVLRRAYRGKAETAGLDPYDRGRTTTTSAVHQLRRLAAAGPSSALDATVYSAFAAGARLLLASPRTDIPWERDESSRAA